MNIAVATCAIGNSFCKTVKPGLDSKKEYCEMHDYSFVVGGDDIYDKDRPPAWSKINLLRKILGDYMHKRSLLMIRGGSSVLSFICIKRSNMCGISRKL
jgi:hypothetical protein